jgi:hypothetical protein
MIAEKLLGMDYGAAAISIDAAQIKGVLPLPSLRRRSPGAPGPTAGGSGCSWTLGTVPAIRA